MKKMKFNLWRKYGALNLFSFFDVTLALMSGHDVVNGDSGIDVIWSVLFNGLAWLEP